MMLASFLHLCIPMLSSGFFLASAIVLGVMYRSFRETAYMTGVILILTTFIYALAESAAVWMWGRGLPSAEVLRFQHLISASYILTIPLFLNSFLKLNKGLRRINRGIMIAGGVMTVVAAAGTYLFENLYLIPDTATVFTMYEAEGIIFHGITVGLGVSFLWGMVCSIAEITWYRNSRSFYILFTGVVLAVVFGCMDIGSRLWPPDTGPGGIPTLGFSWSILGLDALVMSLLISFAVRFSLAVGGISAHPSAQENSRGNDALRLSHYDVATGLPNRRAFEARMQKLLMSTQNGSHALLYLDVDNFKDLKTNLGHVIGEEYLKILVARLRGVLRESDVLYRIGADEFMLILHEITHPSDAAVVAEKLIVQANKPVQTSGNIVYSSSSIGITIIPEDGDGVDELVRHAHTALLQAKRTRNAFRFYTRAMEEEILNRIKITGALRNAIDKKKFELYYQPIFSKHGSIIGAEALLRWFDDDLGPVSPEVFIPLAEEVGLMTSLGSWVLKQAFDDGNHLKSLGAPLSLSVNLSTKQLTEEHLCSMMCALLESPAAENPNLNFEITETSIMEDRENNLATLRKLSDNGYAVALDDFGTGYSSLSYLRDLPITKIKVDKSFVKNLPLDARDASLVRGIISLAKDIGLIVVAEGVETADQFLFLKQAGCDQFQGYFFCTPLPKDEFIGFLLQYNADRSPVFDRNESGRPRG
jgi:diguanylate cyclase (GGDEF)-like protein